MPSLPAIRTLVKSDRRSQWSALKSKHSQAISAKKLNFDSKLGPALDKYQVQVKAVTRLFTAEQVSQPAVQKLLTTARPLGQIANYYLDKVKGLGNPAEKELTAFLKTLASDCQGWEQVLDLFEEKVTPKATPAQQAAVRELYGALDALMAQLINLGRSLPDTLPELKTAGKKWELPPKYKGPLAEKDWRKLLDLKAQAIIPSATRLRASSSAVQTDIGPLLTASVRFNLQPDYRGLKERAQAVAAGSLAAFYEQSGSYAALAKDPEYKSRLGFDKGLPGINYRRSSISADQAHGYAGELIKTIQRLP